MTRKLARTTTMTIREYGELWNQTMEEFMLWSLDTIRLSGRDIIAMIIGFGTCLIIWALSEAFRREKK